MYRKSVIEFVGIWVYLWKKLIVSNNLEIIATQKMNYDKSIFKISLFKNKQVNN